LVSVTESFQIDRFILTAAAFQATRRPAFARSHSHTADGWLALAAPGGLTVWADGGATANQARRRAAICTRQSREQ
jgi:hypothetical protein